MAAAGTDKWTKVSKRWVGQIGSGAVADGTVTTIPLASTTNLPTDTAVCIVIDRVDANGVPTPNTEETVLGVVSSSNLVSCTRGLEGTAQEHNAGAVVEVLWTAAGWNNAVDSFLTGHHQDGSHILNTDGTLADDSDTEIPSQKAVKTYADSKAQPSVHAVTSATDLNSGSTSYIDYTGLSVTFTPGVACNALLLFHSVNVNAAASGDNLFVVNKDGSVTGNDPFARWDAPASIGAGLNGTTAGMMWITGLDTTAHTIKIQAKTNAGGTLHTNYGSLTIILFPS